MHLEIVVTHFTYIRILARNVPIPIAIQKMYRLIINITRKMGHTRHGLEALLTLWWYTWMGVHLLLDKQQSS